MKLILILLVVLLVIVLVVAVYLFKENNKLKDTYSSREMPAARPKVSVQSPTPKPAPAASPAPPAPPAPQAKKEHWFLGMGGVIAEKNYFIGHKTVTIGRDFNNYIQVVDEQVSRQHAQLSIENGSMKIVDMSSRLGIFVNNQKVDTAILEDNDIVGIGHSSFLYKRQGNYGENSGLERKNVKAEVQDETLAAGDFAVKNLIDMAVVETDGDLEAAAKLLRINLDKLKRIHEADK